MRKFVMLITGWTLVSAAGMVTLSLTLGQERPALPPPPTSASQAVQPAAAPRQTSHDLTKWAYFPKQVYLSAQRGSEWLQRANRSDGRFIAGYVPALRTPLNGDSFTRQAGATLALGKAAAYFKDDKAGAIARQALLTLLEDTAVEDPKNPVVRVCTLPAGMANYLGAPAVVVQAIHELPTPAADLLTQADQLCNGIRRLQRADGSFSFKPGALDTKSETDDNEAVSVYSGEALHALMRSQLTRPAPWKLDIVRKALPYYHARWRASKDMVMVARQSAAYSEAYLQAGDRAFADFVFEMNDWLCAQQYQQMDPQHPLWVGGFMDWADGRPVPVLPHIGSAACAESLVAAARAARKAGDVERWDRYKATLERSLQFLMTLQYTEANSQHFADWYRPLCLGGFHGSHEDGNIRLDYTQQAVCGMIGYLEYVTDRR